MVDTRISDMTATTAPTDATLVEVSIAGTTRSLSLGTLKTFLGSVFAKLSGGTFTGAVSGVSPAVDDSSAAFPTTAWFMGQLASAAPVMDGAAAVGTATRAARADHAHPTDASRAPLASPALTGTPTAPTPAAGDASTKLATTAYADRIGATIPTKSQIVAACYGDPLNSL